MSYWTNLHIRAVTHTSGLESYPLYILRFSKPESFGYASLAQKIRLLPNDYSISNKALGSHEIATVVWLSELCSIGSVNRGSMLPNTWLLTTTSTDHDLIDHNIICSCDLQDTTSTYPIYAQERLISVFHNSDYHFTQDTLGLPATVPFTPISFSSYEQPCLVKVHVRLQSFYLRRCYVKLSSVMNLLPRMHFFVIMCL